MIESPSDFARYQPFTPIIETMRGLWMGRTSTGASGGHEAWLAIAYCAGILLVSSAAASWLFSHRRTALGRVPDGSPSEFGERVEGDCGGCRDVQRVDPVRHRYVDHDVGGRQGRACQARSLGTQEESHTYRVA